jgi:factor associated with neutral sphingomyelinase activation
MLKIYALKERRQLRSTQISDLVLSSCSLQAEKKSLILGSWDNCVYVYSIDYGRVVDKVLAHDDAVSCVCLDKQAQQLLTGSWDGTAKLWQVLPSGIHKTPLLDLLDIEAEIKCLDLHSSQLAAFGASDGTVTFADLRLGKVVGNVSAHTAAVTGCQLSPDGTSVITCSKDKWLKVVQPPSLQTSVVNTAESLR